MLFKLTNELIDEGILNSKKEKVVRAIENILRSVWESKHLMTAEIDVIIALKNIITNPDCLSVLIDFENNYAFKNYDNIKYFVEIVASENTMQYETENDAQKLVLSIDYFQKSDLVSKTIILCEDEQDSLFFEQIARFFCLNHNININLSYSEENGGGVNTHKSFQKHIDKSEKFCLCFADTDKKYPTDSIKETLHKLRSCNNPKHFCKLIELEVHEIENLLPFNYLELIKNDSIIQLNGVAFINTIYQSHDSCFLQFLDIKKGIKVKEVKNNPDYFNFTKILYSYCNNQHNINDIHSLNDEIVLIPPVGKVIKVALSNLAIFNNSPQLLSFQNSEWNKIGSVFTFWTCARIDELLNI